MSGGKPGTDLVPASSHKKAVPVEVRSAGSLVARRIEDLVRFADIPEGGGSPPAELPVAVPVDQSRSKVGQDQVAGDKVDSNKVAGDVLDGNAVKIDKQYNIQLPRSATVIEKLLAKLQHEIDEDILYSDTITRLQRYHGGVPRDDVIGLVSKLQRAGRDHEIDIALEQKEDFAKLLETWSLYHSAQEIFVYLLARAEHVFNTEVFPEIALRSIGDINRQVNRDIVNPMVDECAISVLQIDHVSAMGMLYWLAEQCFIRWH